MKQCSAILFFCLSTYFAFGQTAAGGKLVPFQDANKLWGLKNGSGQIVAPAEFGYVSFQEVYWQVANASSTLVGVMDLNGKLLTPLKYEKIYDFKDGLAVVQTTSEEEEYLETVYHQGVINLKGEEIIPLAYNEVGGFYQGLTYVGKCDEYSYCKYDYIDVNGKQITHANYSQASIFSKDGLAKVQIGAKFGFINTSGTLVIPAIYMSATTFVNGKSTVRLDSSGELFTIDVAGNAVK